MDDTDRPRLRIAYVYRHFNRTGSIETLYLRHAERLARDASVTLFCARVDRAKTAAPLLFRDVEPLVHSRHRIGYAVECASFARRATRALKADRRSFDLVHVEGFAALEADVVTVHAVRRAEREHCREHIHGSRSALRHALGSLLRPQSLVVESIERQLLAERHPLCICPSSAVRDDIVRIHGVPADRIHVIPYGIDLARYEVDPRQRVERRALHGADGLVLLLVATSFQRKGVDIAIRALARVQARATLWIVGGEDPEPYRRLAREVGVADDVRFVGRVAWEELPQWYSAADVVLAPSRQDSWNLPVIEGLAAGRAVVASEFSGSAEAIHDGENGFVLAREGDPAVLAALIDRLADPELLGRVWTHARSSAAPFDEDEVYARIRAVYDRAVELRGTVVGVAR